MRRVDGEEDFENWEVLPEGIGRVSENDCWGGG